MLLGPARQVVVISCAVLAGGASCWLLAARSERRLVDAGFWFEPVTYNSEKLGGPITTEEIATVASVARSEIAHAFAGLPIELSDRRDATYRVRVVQNVHDLRFSREVEVAGESRAISGFGGQGAVSFVFLASGALVYAPADADRPSMI